MKYPSIDISSFIRDSSFYGELKLLITIKSFELQKIRARYLESRKKRSGKVGSIERREYTIGGVASITIHKGTLAREEVLCRVMEPRGICTHQEIFGLAAESRVLLLTPGEQRQITNPWFSYIHTLDIDPGQEHLLISSSGFDCMFEYRLEDLEKTWEWFAWEHGFNVGQDAAGNTQYLTRNAGEAEKLVESGNPVLYIKDPGSTKLPTAQRAAFINSALYDRKDPGIILATFFHDGKVRSLSRRDGDHKQVFEGLTSPHGGRNYQDGHMVTDTAGGSVRTQNKEGENNYIFHQLPGKPDELGALEWIQNSLPLGDIIVAIDSNRTSFVIIDTEKQLYDIIPYNNNWAVQDLVMDSLSDVQRERVRSLS